MTKNYPIPENHQDFEKLVCDLFNVFYQSLGGLQLYGRLGQYQAGIDILTTAPIIYTDKHGGKKIVIQCKHTKDLVGNDKQKEQKELIQLLNKELKSALDGASKNLFQFDTFIFASTFGNDAKIQDEAKLLSESFNLTVQYYSWDTINNLLNDPKCQEVVEKYYSQTLNNKNLDLIVQNSNSNAQKTQKQIEKSEQKSQEQLDQVIDELEAINKKMSLLLKNFPTLILTKEDANLLFSKITGRNTFQGWIGQATSWEKNDPTNALRCVYGAEEHFAKTKTVLGEQKTKVDKLKNKLEPRVFYFEHKKRGDELVELGDEAKALWHYKQANYHISTSKTEYDKDLKKEGNELTIKTDAKLKKKETKDYYWKILRNFGIAMLAIFIFIFPFYLYSSHKKEKENEINYQKYMADGERCFKIDSKILEQEPILYDSAIFYFKKAKELDLQTNNDSILIKKLENAITRQIEYKDAVQKFIKNKKETAYTLSGQYNNYKTIFLKINKKYGYMKDDILIIYPKYLEAKNFDKSGTAEVLTSDGWFKIDAQGINLGKK